MNAGGEEAGSSDREFVMLRELSGRLKTSNLGAESLGGVIGGEMRLELIVTILRGGVIWFFSLLVVDRWLAFLVTPLNDVLIVG